MSKYIDLELALNELLRLYEEDVDAYGVEIPETFDYKRAKEALSDLPTIEVSEDCISREWVKGICETMLDEEMLGHMLGHIEDAPSVVPSREEGEWIDNGDRYFRCSLCGIKDTDNWTWCHGCGAKMKGASNE